MVTKSQTQLSNWAYTHMPGYTVPLRRRWWPKKKKYIINMWLYSRGTESVGSEKSLRKSSVLVWDVPKWLMPLHKSLNLSFYVSNIEILWSLTFWDNLYFSTCKEAEVLNLQAFWGQGFCLLSEQLSSRVKGNGKVGLFQSEQEVKGDTVFAAFPLLIILVWSLQAKKKALTYNIWWPLSRWH